MAKKKLAPNRATEDNGNISADSDSEMYKARGFCATLADGKTQCVRSDYVEDLGHFVSKSDVAWVDFIVDDFEKEPLQVALDNGARKVLVPIENKRQFLEVSADVVEKIDPIFYGDIRTALMKALNLQ